MQYVIHTLLCADAILRLIFLIILFMFAAHYKTQPWGMLLFRLAIGGVFMMHGWQKLLGGTEVWGNLGRSLSTFGINFAPEFWGFMAMFSELFGGALIILGFLYIPALALTAITMLVAMTVDAGKIAAGASLFEAFMAVRVSLLLLLLSVAGMLMGPGRLSIDALISKKMHKDCPGHCDHGCNEAGECLVAETKVKSKKTIIKA